MSCAAATIVAKPYWAFARVLARSFRQHHPDIPFYVLLADEADAHIAPADEPFTVVPLADLDLPDLPRLRFQYAQQTFSYACTPWLLAHLLERGHTRVVFFKQETLVLGNVSSLFDRLTEASILLTPHLVAPLEADAVARELNILLSGTFNVGILGVSAATEASRFLCWWQDRLTIGCRHDVAGGMHFEQRWLDLAAAYFQGVAILHDAAFNIGHWNLPERRVSLGASGEVLVGGKPCRVFRFSGYDPERPMTITRYNSRLSWAADAAVRSVFEDFHARLIAEGHEDCRTWPYAFANFDNGVPIPEMARRILLEHGLTLRIEGDPRDTGGPNSYWTWLNAAESGSRVTRMWREIYQHRPDLRLAFPEVPGADDERFLAWARDYGCLEHAVPTQMLPRGLP